MRLDLLSYVVIFVDCCLRYYDLVFLKDDSVVQWLAFLSTEAARKIETPIAFLFTVAPISPLARKIQWTWLGWLTWDFLQQVNDKNYGAQLWELVIFAVIVSIIIYEQRRKSRKLV